MLRKSFLFLFFSVLISVPACQTPGALNGKQVESDIEQFDQIINPPKEIKRTAEMPLVAAIPGLNVPLAPVGHKQFGNLIRLLKEENIPAFVVAYDEKVHPLSDVSGLFSKEHSISVNRALPLLSTAVIRENAIREKQGAPPLKELVLVSYSQGSVLAMDLLRYIAGFRLDWEKFINNTGDEWNYLKKDPEFLLFKEQAQNFLTLKYILAQNEKKVFQNYFLLRFSERLSQKLGQSVLRLKKYLNNPEEVFPDQKIFKGKNGGYPRQYPKTRNWISRTGATGSLINRENPLSFWMKYVEFEPFLPVQFRLFSMAGSFFGSPAANKAAAWMNLFPGLSKLFAGRIEEQVKDTRLGTRNHLYLIQAILKYRDQTPDIKSHQNVYFIVGANGNKGDGFVDQSCAHISSHFYTQIPYMKLRDSKEGETLKPGSRRLPRYPITALKIHHLPEKRLFFPDIDAAAFIRSPENITYPFLLSFIKRDYEALKNLHIAENQKLVQFMVVADLPLSGDLSHTDFKLIPQSKNIKISGRFYNETSHAIAWTGHFKEGTYLNWFKEPRETEKVFLELTKENKEKVRLELDVSPGTNHFVKLNGSSGETEEPYLLGLPRFFEWTPDGIKIKYPKEAI